jgi:hypothetical protein
MSGIDSPSRFADTPAPEPRANDAFAEMIESMTVAEIKEGVEAGDLNAAEVVAAEKQGKNRVTVLALETTAAPADQAEEAQS